MAIQQLDLGAVYDTLMRKNSQDLQGQQEQRLGALNALQMARYQREDDQAQKKQSALSRLISLDPNDTEGRRSALFEAAPEYAAKAEAARLFPNSLTGRDRYIETPSGLYDLGAQGGPALVKGTGGTGFTDINGNPVGGPEQPPVQVASAGNAVPPMPVGRAYADGVRSVENATGNPNARNPNSSATGDGQFIESTWLDMINRKAPGLAQGKSREEILAMRGDPEISAKMTEEYALDNQRIFEQNGIQATPALLYSAHHFGPDAAVKFAKASPDTPLTAILSPEAIKANPHLTNLTVGQARANQERRFSGVAMPGQQPQQTAEAQQQPRPTSTTPGAAVGPLLQNGKVVPGWGIDANGQRVPLGNNTTVNVDTKGDIKQHEGRGAALGKWYDGVLTKATSAQSSMAQARLGLALADTDADGRELPTVLQNKASAAAVAMGLDVESPLIKGLLGRVSDGQTFNGTMMNLVLEKQTQQAGPQTDKDAENIKATLASLGNTPQAREFLLRTSIALSQRDVDKLEFVDRFADEHGDNVKGAEIAWNKHLINYPLFGVNPSSKKPVFYQEFQSAVHEANPDASEEDVLGLWRSKYGRSAK